jgi:hypothetical protein
MYTNTHLKLFCPQKLFSEIVKVSKALLNMGRVSRRTNKQDSEWSNKVYRLCKSCHERD